MKFIKIIFCLGLLAIGSKVQAQLKIDHLTLGVKIGFGLGKFQPITPVSSAQYQRLELVGLNNYFVDSRIADSKFFMRYELGLAKPPGPYDYMLDLEASFSPQLFWQPKEDGLVFGTGLRAALLLSIAGETSIFVYSRSAYDLSIPLLVEKRLKLGGNASFNVGLMTAASLTRTLGDCLWWENPNGLAITPCRGQLIREGLIYFGLLYKLG
ncbi:MAG: hypothetical protein AAF927_23345 [Bacteroidota bacterium]